MHDLEREYERNVSEKRIKLSCSFKVKKNGQNQQYDWQRCILGLCRVKQSLLSVVPTHGGINVWRCPQKVGVGG